MKITAQKAETAQPLLTNILFVQPYKNCHIAISFRLTPFVYLTLFSYFYRILIRYKKKTAINCTFSTRIFVHFISTYYFCTRFYKSQQ